MGAIILVLIVIGALAAIAGGVWVATALVSAVFTHRVVPSQQHRANQKSSSPRT